MSKDGIGPLISAATTLIPMHPEDESTEQSSNENAILIIVGVGIAAMVIAGILVFVWLRKKSNKVVDNANIIPVESISIFVEEGQSPDKTLEHKNET